MTGTLLADGGAPFAPGGSSGQVQINQAGVFGGITNTALTALINPATAALSGALPSWPNNTTTFFRGDGTYDTLNFAAIGGTLAPAQCTLATNADFGCIKGDGSTITLSAGTISVTTATTSQLGAVKPDGSSITISGGVISTNNAALVAPQAGRFLPSLAGSCSASSPFTCMQLCQYKGNQILVNGGLIAIPSGQCVGSTGGIIGAYNSACIEDSGFVTTCSQVLSANTLYYAYVGLITGTPTMIWSTNTHSPSLGTSVSANGNEIMTGDSSRSLIGMCYTDAAGKFTGTANQQNCSSWFNPVYDGLQATVTGNFSAGSYTDINSADHLTTYPLSQQIAS